MKNRTLGFTAALLFLLLSFSIFYKSLIWISEVRQGNLTKEIAKFKFLSINNDKAAERLCEALMENYDKVKDPNLRQAISDVFPQVIKVTP